MAAQEVTPERAPAERRTTRQRIAHALAFEAIALLILVPIGSVGLDIGAAHAAGVALSLSLVATAWNFFFNILFDRAMIRRFGTLRKTPSHRFVHAALFEISLTAITLPIIAYALGIGLWEALIVDLALVVFFFFYTLAFNWAWDAATLPRDRNAAVAARTR